MAAAAVAFLVGWPAAAITPEPGAPTAVGPVLRVDHVNCGEKTFGSAVLVDGPHGPVAVTNRHVVRGAASVDSSSGELAVAGLVPGRDLALLEPPADAAGAVDVGAPAVAGVRVQVIGFPGGEYTEAWGRVVSVERRVFGATSVAVLVVDVVVHPGSSGGAVLDTDGRLVGVVAARDPRSGWAVAHPAADLPDAVTAGVEPCR